MRKARKYSGAGKGKASAIAVRLTAALRTPPGPPATFCCLPSLPMAHPHSQHNDNSSAECSTSAIFIGSHVACCVTVAAKPTAWASINRMQVPSMEGLNRIGPSAPEGYQNAIYMHFRMRNKKCEHVRKKT